MRRLFGSLGGEKKPAVPAPSLDDAGKAIEGRIQGLENKIKGLEAEVMKAKAQMAKAKPGSALHNSAKQKALRYLKQKKMLESQRDQLMQQSFTIDQTNFVTQTMSDTMTQVNALKAAKATMDKQFKEMDLADVEDLQDDLQDMFDTHNEIQDLLSRSFATPDGLDEDELESELMSLEAELDADDLEQDELPSYLSPGAKDPLESLPAVPQTIPGAAPQAAALRQL